MKIFSVSEIGNVRPSRVWDLASQKLSGLRKGSVVYVEDQGYS